MEIVNAQLLAIQGQFYKVGKTEVPFFQISTTLELSDTELAKLTTMSQSHILDNITHSNNGPRVEFLRVKRQVKISWICHPFKQPWTEAILKSIPESVKARLELNIQRFSK